MSNYEGFRQKYNQSELSEKNAVDNPFDLFQRWMVEAINNMEKEPNAMILSTVDQEGMPSSRTVLLKEIFEDQFLFYTNYESHKARDIENNPQVSLLFLWLSNERQVRISGIAQKLTKEKSNDYFQKRPKGSQIGAWTSPQSKVIANREELNSMQSIIEERFKDSKTIDKPPFWGGFGVKPKKIEFWQGRDNRLHDRLLYTEQEDGSWKIERLAP